MEIVPKAHIHVAQSLCGVEANRPCVILLQECFLHVDALIYRSLQKNHSHARRCRYRAIPTGKSVAKTSLDPLLGSACPIKATTPSHRSTRHAREAQLSIQRIIVRTNTSERHALPRITRPSHQRVASRRSSIDPRRRSARRDPGTLCLA